MESLRVQSPRSLLWPFLPIIIIHMYMVSSVRIFFLLYISREDEKFMNSFVFPIFIQWLGLRIDRFFLHYLTSFSYFSSQIFRTYFQSTIFLYVEVRQSKKKPIKLELLYSLLNTWHFNISSVNQFIMWCNKLFWTALKLFNSITGIFFLN